MSEEENDTVIVRAMIDIETLSIENNAVITDIGLYAFDNTGALLAGVGFYPEWKDQILKGRHIRPDTIKWWSTQPGEPTSGLDSVADCFEKLAFFCKEMGIQEYWFRGPQFDAVKLEDLAKQFDCEVPWRFNQVRDSRTLDIFKLKRPDKPDVKHEALDDAKQQALDVIYVLKHLEVKQPEVKED